SAFRRLPWRHSLARRLYMPAAPTLPARRADAVMVPSHSAARDFVRLFRARPERVAVIPEAAPPAMRPIDDRMLLDAARDRLHLPERFVLSLGTLEPGKNRVNLLRAFALLRRRGPPHRLPVPGPP